MPPQAELDRKSPASLWNSLPDDCRSLVDGVQIIFRDGGVEKTGKIGEEELTQIWASSNNPGSSIFANVFFLTIDIRGAWDIDFHEMVYSLSQFPYAARYPFEKFIFHLISNKAGPGWIHRMDLLSFTKELELLMSKYTESLAKKREVGMRVLAEKTKAQEVEAVAKATEKLRDPTMHHKVKQEDMVKFMAACPDCFIAAKPLYEEFIGKVKACRDLAAKVDEIGGAGCWAEAHSEQAQVRAKWFTADGPTKTERAKSRINGTSLRRYMHSKRDLTAFKTFKGFINKGKVSASANNSPSASPARTSTPAAQGKQSRLGDRTRGSTFAGVPRRKQSVDDPRASPATPSARERNSVDAPRRTRSLGAEELHFASGLSIGRGKIAPTDSAPARTQSWAPSSLEALSAEEAASEVDAAAGSGKDKREQEKSGGFFGKIGKFFSSLFGKNAKYEAAKQREEELEKMWTGEKARPDDSSHRGGRMY